MKSTGEVMGSDKDLAKALYKAFEASGLHILNLEKHFSPLQTKAKKRQHWQRVS